MTADTVLKSAPLRKSRQPDGLSEREVAQYTADIMLELRQLARNAKLNTLQGLIELCYYEAFSVANQPKIPAEELEHLAQLERARGTA
jgi:hypothetical protein